MNRPKGSQISSKDVRILMLKLHQHLNYWRKIKSLATGNPFMSLSIHSNSSDNFSSIPAPKKILVIAMRHLGDVLLTTPLLHSLRTAYPQSELNILVYQNTAAILEGNPDINNIISTPQKPSSREYFSLIKQLFRQYDLAISTQTGDRPSIYAFLAATFRIAEVPPRQNKDWWKRFLFQRWTEFDDINTHTVIQHLRLNDLLNIRRYYAVVTPQTQTPLTLFKQATDYAVLHIYPMWTYKRWTAQGWSEITHYLRKSGFQLLISGSPAAEEQEYIKHTLRLMPDDTINLAGKTSLAQLSHIISKAKLFIGPDTGITHLAAATGIPVIALYGPTNPVKWAPWPFAYTLDQNPFKKVGSQTVNNVHLIQGEAECVPCHQEGCDRHRQSHSRCLDTLTSQRVIEKIKQII